MYRLIIIVALVIPTVGLSQSTTNENITNSTKNSNYINAEINAPSQDVRSKSYYEKEADNYERKAKEMPSSTQAWLNFYKSSLYATYAGSSKVIDANEKQELDDIVEEMKQKIPGTFEYNLAVYLNGLNNTGLVNYLAKAEEVNPNQVDVIEQFVAYYAITGNDSKCKDYVSKHRKAVKYEAFYDEYAYNLLQSVDDNSVLFTHGIMDTYPLYFQQMNNKVKPNVEIINIDYLHSEEYRKAIVKRLGVTFSYTNNNYTAAFEIASKLKNLKSIYFSNTFSKADLKKHATDFEICGLALRYGTNKVNEAQLEKTWNEKFKKALIEKAGMKDDYARKMAGNYQPMLVTLYQHYKTSNKPKESEKIKGIITAIAKLNGNEKQITDLLNN